MTKQIKVESEVTFTIVPHWLLDVCTPIEISTYIALGKYANNKTKECWPSVATISKDIGRAKKNTIKAILRDSLEAGAGKSEAEPMSP